MSSNLVVERNKCLIEWISGIFGIFWGVWWGVFLTAMIEKPITSDNPYSLLDTDVILCCSAVIIALFVFFYVHWLWSLRRVSSRTYTRTTGKKLLPALIFWFCFSTVAWLLGNLHSLPLSIVIYGIVLTLFWMLLDVAILVSY